MSTISDQTDAERGLRRYQFITIGDLEKFKVELLKKIAKLKKSTSNQPNKKWLRSSEVRKLLNISPGTLQNLRINGLLPYTKIGGTMYYKSEDLDYMMTGKDSSHMAGEKRK